MKVQKTITIGDRTFEVFYVEFVFYFPEINQFAILPLSPGFDGKGFNKVPEKYRHGFVYIGVL